MTPPRCIKSGTSYYVTVRAVNRSFRFVPKKRVIASIRFILAAVLGKYRDANRLQVHEFLFMSNHYHLLITDLDGCVPDAIQELNSLLSRQLNALRGFKGSNIEKEYNLVEIVGEERLLEHALYTLLNAVRANLVAKALQWKGASSLRMEYGVPELVGRPKCGLWKGTVKHKNSRASKRSGRAAYARRWTTPDVAALVIDRPPVLLQLSDSDLREEIRARLQVKEEAYAAERHRQRRRVAGWAKCVRQHFLVVPGTREELFALVPTFSSSYGWERVALAVMRKAFNRAFRRMSALHRAGKVAIFPYGSWLPPRRWGATCAPAPG